MDDVEFYIQLLQGILGDGFRIVDCSERSGSGHLLLIDHIGITSFLVRNGTIDASNYDRRKVFDLADPGFAEELRKFCSRRWYDCRRTCQRPVK